VCVCGVLMMICVIDDDSVCDMMISVRVIECVPSCRSYLPTRGETQHSICSNVRPVFEAKRQQTETREDAL
jgi:hypothetical protein